jgi:hypothetical protein
MTSLGRFVLLGTLLFVAVRALDPAAGAAPGGAVESARGGLEDPTPMGDTERLAAAARDVGLDRSDPVVRARLVRNLRFLGHEGSEEALYREALAIGMDRSDVVIERRLADRMAARLRAVAWSEAPTETTLRRWYARHRHRWRRAPAVAFTHVFVSRARHGPNIESVAQARLASLRSERVDPAAASARGDPFLLNAVVPLRRLPELVRQLGAGFAEAVAASPRGAWSGPIASSYGLHLVWVHERRAARIAPFEEVRVQVEDAWREERGEEALRDALVGLQADGAATARSAELRGRASDRGGSRR